MVSSVCPPPMGRLSSLVLPLPMQQNDPLHTLARLLAIDTATLWLVGTGIVLTVLLGVFVWLLARQRPGWLISPLLRLDHWLQDHVPRLWHLLRGRFSTKAWHGLSLTVSLFLFLFFTALFAQITEGWMDQEALYRIDRTVHQAFAGTLTQGTVDAFRIITHFGDVLTMLGAALVLGGIFWYRGRWWRLVALMLATAGGQAVLWSLKYVFGRQRPGSQLVEAAGQSFPSGHTFTATVLYGFITVIVWHWTDSTAIRMLTSVVLGGLVLLVGISRILLSVHWTSDVIGGLTIGLAWLLSSFVLTRILRARHTAG